MQLEQVQARFAAALIDASATPASLPELVGGDDHVRDRLALHRGNVRAAWEKTLANAFPVVAALVGKEFFAALARTYGHTHPSVSGDLNTFGAGLAGFIARSEHAELLPYLCDVAALEWAVHCAHHAADAEPVARERIASLLPQDLLTARFALHPACLWFESRFPIASIWRAHQAQPDIGLPDSFDRGECALVARPRWRVEVTQSSTAEIAALERLHAGGDMDSAIGAALAKDVCFDFGKMLVRWLDLAVLVSVPVKSGEDTAHRL